MTPRVAFFADSFHEVNGVALTCRQFDAYARKNSLPFVSIHAGSETKVQESGSHKTIELNRGSASIAIESDLAFDPFLWRRGQWLLEQIRTSEPNLVHITGPSDIGILGAWVANQLCVPLVASWHTNVHEYGGRRFDKRFAVFPGGLRRSISSAAQNGTFHATARFYKMAELLFAPNQELMDLLRAITGKPCYRMVRGVDSEMFNPNRRPPGPRPFTIGYVGRLSPEKNVRFLAEIEKALLAAGHADFRILIAGVGEELDWLAANLKNADFVGVLERDALADVYALMDVFAIPSETDTFGNVVQEALATGVPAIVTSGGGPKFIVRHEETGYVSQNGEEFIQFIVKLKSDPELLSRMSAAARTWACSASWDNVFDHIYSRYEDLLRPEVLPVAS